jgi:hypothetical protein
MSQAEVAAEDLHIVTEEATVIKQTPEPVETVGSILEDVEAAPAPAHTVGLTSPQLAADLEPLPQELSGTFTKGTLIKITLNRRMVDPTNFLLEKVTRKQLRL